MRWARDISIIGIFASLVSPDALAVCPVMIVSGVGESDGIVLTSSQLRQTSHPAIGVQLQIAAESTRLRTHATRPMLSFYPGMQYTVRYPYPDGKAKPVTLAVKSVTTSDGFTWTPSKKQPCRTLRIVPRAQEIEPLRVGMKTTPARRIHNLIYGDFRGELYAEIRREAFGEDIGQNSWHTADEQDRFLTWLDLSAGKRLLDVACGAGGPALRIAASSGCTVAGVDVHEKPSRRHERSRKDRGLEPRAEFQAADANLGLPIRRRWFRHHHPHRRDESLSGSPEDAGRMGSPTEARGTRFVHRSHYCDGARWPIPKSRCAPPPASTSSSPEAMTNS
mgnify:CR=1 FL=1